MELDELEIVVSSGSSSRQRMRHFVEGVARRCQ